jgi:hypothetical protein
MRVLGPVVQILRPTMLHPRYQPATSNPIAGQLVGHQHPGHVLQAREQLAEEPGRGLGVPPGGDQDVQHVPVLVDGAPQVLPLTVDREEYLVKVPRVTGAGPAAS